MSLIFLTNIELLDIQVNFFSNNSLNKLHI